MTRDTPHAWNELKAVAHLIFLPADEERIVAVYEKQGYAAALKALTVTGDRYYSQGLVDNARLMTFIGDKAAALQYLERALKNREGWMIVVESDPAFDSLRSDPEYSRIVRDLRTVSDPALRPLNPHSR